ncbi:MAG TPA: hypothetical protein VG474_16260 [Solirubrobacteraceae bacterium]|nr:hypothetical protein [Solirubrobacteraceae bacterium]
MTRRIMPFVLALAASLALAAPAQADLLTTIFKDYVEDSKLDPCRYTQRQLQQLRDVIPNDVNAYDAGFIAALDDALARRARGECSRGGSSSSGAPAPPPPAAGGGTAAPPPASTSQAPAAGVASPGATAAAQPPPTPSAEPTAAPAVAARDAIGIAARASEPATEPPFPILALAILAGLLAIAALLVGLARWRGWEPLWADRFRHAAGEAGWRASSTWSEFADFVRFGR